MKSVIGLDIGLKNIKLVNLALNGKNVELLKLEYIEATKPSNQYEIMDLAKFMFKNQGLKLNIPVCLSISADDSFSKRNPFSRYKEKTKKAIEVLSVLEEIVTLQFTYKGSIHMNDKLVGIIQDNWQGNICFSEIRDICSEYKIINTED